MSGTGSTTLNNKYKPGGGGVGASSVAIRRAKNRLATVCNSESNTCGAFYNRLGVYARNPSGYAPRPTITAPSAPTLVSLTPTDTHLILNFTLGADGGSPITDIEYSTNNGATWTSSGQITSPVVITGLNNGTSYQVAVRAINAVGTGPSSNTLSGTPNPAIASYSAVQTTTWVAPAGVTTVEYLVVGGGGGSGGGHDTGGGGGGGGGMVITGSLSVTPGTSYDVIVGDGGEEGLGSTSTTPRETNGSGGDSSAFGSIIALGGGVGYCSRSALNPGGGSAGGNQVSGVTASKGGNGGGSIGDGNGAGGGGGGNTSNGSNGVSNTGGNGGAGVSNSISGSSVTYGAGGRGADGNIDNEGVAGAANTGNGARGGGATSSSGKNGAKGGSGIVIIKF
jgi:hypothetical protein